MPICLRLYDLWRGKKKVEKIKVHFTFIFYLYGGDRAEKLETGIHGNGVMWCAMCTQYNVIISRCCALCFCGVPVIVKIESGTVSHSPKLINLSTIKLNKRFRVPSIECEPYDKWNPLFYSLLILRTWYEKILRTAPSMLHLNRIEKRIEKKNRHKIDKDRMGRRKETNEWRMFIFSLVSILNRILSLITG